VAFATVPETPLDVILTAVVAQEAVPLTGPITVNEPVTTTFNGVIKPRFAINSCAISSLHFPEMIK
jgi:hypothetical protein